ncbi:MAG: hypothetical protein QME74_01860 [Candidatus Edwardsbacteria bacterium]|nr:hypothetical protein [Candidatus Edwardsbacteria bacterium]
MRIERIAIVSLAVLGMAGFVGCGSKANKASPGLTPIAANFYVLHQELYRARQWVKTEAPAQIDAHLQAYADVTGQAQGMAKDVSAEPELKKKQALKTAIDSCLAADLMFLDLEVQAIKLQAVIARLDIRIRDINQRSRGNSFKLRQAQAELDRLSKERLRNRQDLDKLLPELAPAADRCRTRLKQYNFIVAAEKIISYFNAEGIYDPFGWEQRGERRKPAAKHRPVKKPAKRR